MRGWRIARRVASLVESGWEPAPAPIRRCMLLAEGLTSRIRSAVSRPGAPVEVPPSVRVVSVGGVSWGGDGKTAIAAHVASRLRTSGLRVAIAARAYGGHARLAGRVPGGGLSSRTGDVLRWGDEAVMLAALDGPPVWAGPGGREAARAALASAPDAIVIDDGLGIDRMRKDLEIALLSIDLPCTRCLPAGPLRRPLSDTARAHIVGIRAPDGAPAPSLRDQARRMMEAAGARDHPWFGFCLDPVVPEAPGPFHLAAGIARPERFERASRLAGLSIAGTTWLPDHHVPSARDLEYLGREAHASGARSILVTAKDAPRFPSAIHDLDVVVLSTRVRILEQEDELESRLEAIVRSAAPC